MYRKTPERRAEDHLSDLNMAAAIKTLCESSLLRSQAGRRFERRIVKLCNDELQRQLHLLDAAREEIA